MRRMAAVVALVMGTLMPAAAQETPHFEMFGGFMYFKADSGGQNVSLRGWDYSFTENVNHWFGGGIDASGAYGSRGGIREFQHSIVGGPVFAYRQNSSFTPFAHALLGGIRASRGYLGTSEAVTRFTAVFGGGLDVKVRDHLALRVIQADYQVTPFFNQRQDNYRLSAGIVLRFGKK